ncbi:MAG: hypothetical protein GXZ09_11150 [Syntrophomonadaceae bacterium]|jgi:hypothetical protein|nr:hypothetical protein [Syntrophomonadaceae bacterium]
MQSYGTVILAGIVAGFINRWVLLRYDYRHYPTYPHGHITHLALGFIAASLGAVAIPAITEPDWVAVTFLALAAQQFREIRDMERKTLSSLEEHKLITRGHDYIEGIARVFEMRNYLVILTALVTAGVAHLWGWQLALVAGPLMIYGTTKLMSGSTIGEIASIEPAEVSFDGALLKVADVPMMNVGLKAARDKIMSEALAVLIHPFDDEGRLTLQSPGQRMAIIHDVTSILGAKVDIGETELLPMARMHADKGYLALFIVPNEPDMDVLMEMIKRVPVLESARSSTLKSYWGRKAAD